MAVVTLIGGLRDGEQITVDRITPICLPLPVDYSIDLMRPNSRPTRKHDLLYERYLPHVFARGNEFRVAWLHESMKPEYTHPQRAFESGVDELLFHIEPAVAP